MWIIIVSVYSRDYKSKANNSEKQQCVTRWMRFNEHAFEALLPCFAFIQLMLNYTTLPFTFVINGFNPFGVNKIGEKTNVKSIKTRFPFVCVHKLKVLKPTPIFCFFRKNGRWEWEWQLAPSVRTLIRIPMKRFAAMCENVKFGWNV